MRKLLLGFFVFTNIIILLQGLFVKELLCSPDNSMSITPVAVDGATITASDENSRNNVVSAAYNAHDHNDIDQTANTLNVGDAAAGDKTITANNADTNKPYLKYDDTNNYWIVSTDGVAPSVVLQGTGAIFEGTTDDAFEITFSVTDPTADRTQTVQNNSGVLPLGTAGNTLFLTTTGATNVTLPTSGTLVTTAGSGVDIDIGSYELRAQTLQSDVATGTAPLIVASTTKVTNFTADSLDGYNTSTTAAATTIPVSDASGYLPDATVDTTALKTGIGEVSASVATQATLPGGTYGFYPQVKQTGGSDANIQIGYGALGGTYVTLIHIGAQISGGATVYAQQRYVTSSGQDHWLFLLIDKVTKEILQAYSAADHSAYGNGGNFDKMPHPFGNYDETKYEIILVDNDTIAELKAQVTEEKSLLTLVNEFYKPEMSKEEVYKPLHSGKYINEDNKQVKQLVETIPSYIKCRKLIKMNQGELNAKAAKQEQAIQKVEQDKVKKEQDKISTQNKLKVLGLSEDEIKAIKD